MEDVRAAEGSSGLVVASLFAGCGGSSLGYRLAGFRVAYANEWGPVPRRIYDLNKSVRTFVDDSDVREVTGADIATICGGVPDVLDGSPPCTSFSMQGNRDLDAGVELYNEFVRLVGELRPPAFVAENVTGILMSGAKPRFAALLAALRAHGYRIEFRVLDASMLGVAQKRKRVVVIGFREDTELDPVRAFPQPGPLHTIGDAIPDCVGLIVDESNSPTRRHLYLRDRVWPANKPLATITTRGPGPLSWHYVRVLLPNGSTHKVTPDDIRRLCGFPEGFDIGDAAFATAALVYGNAVPPPMAASWATGVRDLLRRG
jgi:DNA (cytosine-5)-methyltransferase 1